VLAAAAFFLTLGGLGVAASTAGAFFGESVVLNPAKTDLTGPAKTILEKPTFLPDALGEASALGGVTEESAAASVFETGSLLPVLSSVVAFGAGTVIGSEICNVIGIEGCWYFHSDGADPVPGVPVYSWSPEGKTSWLPYSWRWSRGKSGYETLFGLGAACGNSLPGGVTKVRGPLGEPYENCAKPKAEKVAQDAELYREGMANRSLEYHATDSGGIGNYAYSPSKSSVTEGIAGVLKSPGSFGTGGAESAAVERVGQHIASQIPGSGVKDPYPHKVSVPSCSGEAWIECKEDLEELDLKPERKELDWSDARLDLAPDEVVELSPAPGTKISVPTETKTIVTTNPEEAGMPLVVPDLVDGETYADYITKLAPGLNPERHNVGEAFTDPHVGPNAVLRTHPDPGTRLDPSTEHDVDIETNPPDAPPAAGAWTAPAIPALDLSPLSGVSIGCNSFPFGVFCWVAAGLANWGSEGECPSFEVPFTSEIRGSTADLTFDTCTFEPAMDIIRPMLVILSFFGVAWLLSASAMGLGGGASADD
jgi:hypothetical protein